MNKIITLIFCVLFSTQALFAQKEINLVDVSIINDGEGRLYCFNRADKTPVEGSIRLIDGIQSEYVETEFKAGYATGAWKAYSNSVLVQEGMYKEGYPDGAFKEYFADGKLKSQVSFVAGKIDGKSVTYHPNGKVATEKEFTKGVENGVDRRYNEDGTLTSDTHYANGKQTGKAVQQISSNVGSYTLTASYKDGLLDGDYSEIFADGTVKAKGRYAAGKKQGKWEYNKADGGKQPTEVYDNSGNLTKKTTYYTNGTVEIERELKDGKEHGVTRKYDSSGKLKSEISFKNGREDGKSTEWITSNLGNYKATGSYINGKRDGEYTEEYEDGQLKAKGSYKNGSKSGKWVSYYSNGKLKDEQSY